MKHEEHPFFRKPPLIGYQGICKNRNVGLIYKEETVAYAMHKLGYAKRRLAEPDEKMTKEFEKMLVDWFYSGDWIEVREDEE